MKTKYIFRKMLYLFVNVSKLNEDVIHFEKYLAKNTYKSYTIRY